MKYVFIGGSLRGYKVLSHLISHNLMPESCFILKEDAHENEKYADRIIEMLAEKNIPYSCKKKLSQDDYDFLEIQNLDFIVVCGWRTLIDTKINQHLKLGIVAAHDSLLPKYRGFAPTNWAVINGEKECGVTLFLIQEGVMDSGEVILQQSIDIMDDEFIDVIYEKVIQATIDLYIDFFSLYEKDEIHTYKQDESLATYTCKRTPEDGKIDWSKKSSDIFNLIRGIAYPLPGAFFHFLEQKYIVRNAKIGEYNHRIYIGRIIGRVIQIDEEGVEVLCGEGTVKLLSVEDVENQSIINPSQIIKSITTKLT